MDKTEVIQLLKELQEFGIPTCDKVRYALEIKRVEKTVLNRLNEPEKYSVENLIHMYNFFLNRAKQRGEEIESLNYIEQL